MDTFIVFCLAFQVTEAFDKLLAFRESKNDLWTIVCSANDNGDALVWNTNLEWDTDTPFKSTYKGKSDQNYCSGPHQSCRWSSNKWNLTDSKQNPMGLVLDSRWEDFREYNNYEGLNQYEYVDKFQKKGSLAFSIRGTNDAHFLLCHTKFYKESICYLITIKDHQYMQTSLQICLYGVETRNAACKPYKNYYIGEEQLSPTEWKHYVLTWDGDTGDITLYNDEKQLLTYNNSELLNNLIEFNLFYKSPNLIHIRYHNYTYLYTEQQGVTLDSSYLELQNNYYLCLQISIGLCAKCSVKVSLFSSSGYHYADTLKTVNGIPTIHGLPTWQNIELNMTIDNPRVEENVIVRIKTVMSDKNNTKGFWAVDSFRICPPPDTMKISRLTKSMHSGWFNRKNPLPNVSCQRISYNRSSNEVVTAHTNAVALKTDDYDCPNGTLCSMSCKNFYESFDANCQNIAICDTKGCTCHVGFTGNSCDKKCDKNKYGYMCERTCGQCLDKPCNYMTGFCTKNKCDNKKSYYIPPYCDIEIHAPPAPSILYVNETSVHARIDMQDVYNKTVVEYMFVIGVNDDKFTSRKINENSNHISCKNNSSQKNILQNATATVLHVRPYQIIFQNSLTLEAIINKLKPGSSYWILCIISIQNEGCDINGLSTDFKTQCNVINDFNIDTGMTNLTIMANIPKTMLHLCPFNFYNVTIKKFNTQTTIDKRKLSEIPFTYEGLEPGTIYTVIIANDKNAQSTLKNVHTKDGISSPVENILFVHNITNVYLQWRQPKKTNGEIKEYEVILNVITYFGCSDLKRVTQPSEFLRTRTNTTNITFCDLQPYVMYTAIIYAWNSNRGEAATVNFSTDATEIPRSSYSNLRKEGSKLFWNQPKDCSVISGPIKASRLIFVGVSKAVMNSTPVVKQTEKAWFDTTINELYGNERYRVYLYPIRNYHKSHNSSSYISLEFDTPPKAPTSVRNLEIVEIDQRNNSILLRWQEPFPPNGKIDHYSVSNCIAKPCTFYIENVPKNNYCPLWDNYICVWIKQDHTKIYNIIVYAINENVNKSGEYAYVRQNLSELVSFIGVSDQPLNMTIRINHNKTVTLSWLHPWKTQLPLKRFIIQTWVKHTKLKQGIYGIQLNHNYPYLINGYKRKYSMVLDLLPSTQYQLSVYPVTIDENFGKSGNVFFETPAAIAFEGNPSFRSQNETMACLHVPQVAHDTINSKIYFVVKGKDPCKEYVKLNQFLKSHVNVKYDEIAWLAGSFSALEYVDNVFCVGDNTIYPGNCQLRAKHYYTVYIIVRADGNSTNDEVAITSISLGDIPRRHDEIWIIPIIILFTVSLLLFFFCKKHIQTTPPEIITEKQVSIIYKPQTVTPVTPNLSENNRSLCESTTDIASLSMEAIPTDDDPPMPIKVKDFEDYVKNAIKSDLLKQQYEMFPRGLTKPCNYGKLPENMSKNRYRNLVAYDESRVVLKKLQDDPFSDYINANYIKGYKMEKRYIATQGPKPNTIIDFWRMIWQENVLVICMLANVLEHGKIKCEQYWPDVGKKKKYGDVKVYNVKHDVFADYTFRILHVTYDGETRQVKHLHYTTWPDHGVPTYTHSAVTYLKKLLATDSGSGPMVVHCSAGVGRTGTIILCDICLRRAAAEGVVDVFSETRSIRNQRVNLVDNKQQYFFAHLLLVECLLSLPTSIPCVHDFPDRIMEMKKQSDIQFQRLKDTTWQDEILRPTIDQTSLSECNIAKHRYPELISSKVCRIYLKNYPQHVEDSDYIAAVYVDGLTTRNRYLASQLPLPSTFSDFWRMITEYNVELIVVLQPPDPTDPTCCPIVPTNNEFKPTPYMNVITKEIIKEEYYTSHKLKLIDNSKKLEPELSITILTSTKYEAGRNKNPSSVDALVKLWNGAERIARGDSPTVVLCHDGVTGCGLYLALSFLLERMAIERECDVCLAIRIVRRSRPEFIPTIEQMEYLYDAALTYTEYFKTYANFS